MQKLLAEVSTRKHRKAKLDKNTDDDEKPTENALIPLKNLPMGYTERNFLFTPLRYYSCILLVRSIVTKKFVDKTPKSVKFCSAIQ